jgi:hypothetical protein
VEGPTDLAENALKAGSRHPPVVLFNSGRWLSEQTGLTGPGPGLGCGA